MRLRTAVHLHLRHIRPLLTAGTVRNRRYHLEHFRDFVGPEVAIKALKPAHVTDWLATLNVAASTLHLRFGTIRYFVGDCIRQGWMKTDPTRDITLPRRPRKLPRALTLDELRALGAALPDARARLIMALAINEGLRRVEICRLEIDDIDFDAMLLRIITAKSGHEDILPLTTDTHDRFLLPYLVERGRGAGPLIRSYRDGRALNPTSVSWMVRNWFIAAGIKNGPYDGKSLHAGRHTCASNLLDAGADPETIQGVLRHASLASTWRYVGGRRRPEDLRPWMGKQPYDPPDAA